MQSQFKKFVVVFAVIAILSVNYSVKAEELLDAASTEAMNDLAEVLDASPGARQALRQARELQRTATDEFNIATNADNAKAELLKEAKKDYDYVVDDAGSYGGPTTPTTPAHVSISTKAQQELEEAAAAVKGAMLITATHPKDTDLTERLAKAQKNWERVSMKVGEIRARIKTQNAPYFNQPSIATEDERMVKILVKIYAAAKAEKANTAKTLLAKAKAKAEAEAAVKAAIDALKELKAERDRIRATEELRKGFIQLRGEVKAVKTAVDLGGETTVAAVEAVGTKVDKTNELLVAIDGKIVDLKTSVDGLKTLMDERTATLISKVGGTALTSEDSAKIGKILTSLTQFVAAQDDSNKADALAKVEERLTRIDEMMTELAAKAAGQKELYVQFYDPCSRRWFQVNTTTKEVVKS